MPKWWPFQKEDNTEQAENEAFQTAESTLRDQIKQQQAEGVSAQAIVYFIENQSQALEKEVQTPVIKGKLRAYDLLYSELKPRMMDNLTNGKTAEMAGQIEPACRYYEQAIKDQVATRFPYEHLRVIYRREDKLTDALRVCQLALNNPFLNDKDQQHFQNWVEKIEHRQSTQTA